MGANLLHGIGNALGLTNSQSPLLQAVGLAPQTPQIQPGTHPLLGATQATAPADDQSGDITVARQAPPRTSPESMGMPMLPTTRNMDPNAIADQHAQLQQNADLARQLYHPGSEFGTHGTLREVIGGGLDILRHLTGFDQKYGQEKWAEKAYGMTSSDPNIAAASTQAAMQQDPVRTEQYQTQIANQQNARANAEAMQGYREAQTQNKNSQILSGFGQSLNTIAARGNDQMTESAYQRMRPAIQKMLDTTYGEGVMTAPANYDPTFTSQLAGAGFSGTNVQRYQTGVLDAHTRQEIAQGRNMTAIEVANIGADARRYQADAVYRAAVNRVAAQGQPLTTETTTTESGSILHPTKTTTTVKGRSGTAAPAQAPSSPAPAASSHPAGWYSKGGVTRYWNGSAWTK